MKKSAFLLAGLVAASMGVHGSQLATGAMPTETGIVLGAQPKAASAQTLASRAVVTPSQTLFGGFQITQQTSVLILVRGNSLGSLGVTNNFLDAPRVRLYNSLGQDLLADPTGRVGFNSCVSSAEGQGGVVDYYQRVRGQPVHARDACVGVVLTPAAYTFTVTPSIAGVTTTIGTSSPSSGEVLFEVTLNP